MMTAPQSSPPSEDEILFANLHSALHRGDEEQASDRFIEDVLDYTAATRVFL
jgi:hypothetical protein